MAGVVKSVETIILTLSNTTASTSDTLGEGQDYANCVPFVNARVTTVGSSEEVSNFHCDVWFTSTAGGTVHVERATALGAIEVEVTVVEFDDTLCNIYSGAWIIDGDDTISKQFAIGSTVTNSKAFLVFHGQCDNPGGNNYDATLLRGRITDSAGDPGGTHVALDRVYDITGNDPEGHWFVVECVGTDFSVDAVDVQLGSSETSDTGTVSVNKANTLLIGSWKCSSSSHAENRRHTVDITLTSDTVVTAQRANADGTLDWHGFAIDFGTGTSVQHDTWNETSADGDEYITLGTPVSFARSMAVISGHGSTPCQGSFPGTVVADVPDAQVQLTLNDSDSGGNFDRVHIQHDTTGGEASNDISFCVIEFEELAGGGGSRRVMVVS